MTYTQAWTRKEKKVVVLLQLVNIEHPLEQWGLDFVGELNPKSSNRRKFSRIAIDYFSWWLE
jgi:hypothetical protein